uniref:Phosphatidylinositol-specific phospholipase C X domain-containing protein n=1 Tax=Oryzias latipes TaxID=8090 RepID=A0A3P9HH52_ORYLA
MLRTPGWWRAACLGLGVPVQVLEILDSSQAGTGFNDKPDLHPSFKNTDWMALIPDETPISAVPIPGTHGSLTFSKLKFAGNQVWTLEQQLRVGVRYFDIHAGMWLASENEISIRDDKWMIDQKINLQTVIEQIRSFLRSHKKEAVVLKLTLHGLQQDKVAALIKKLFGKFENVLWKEKGIPTMEKVRGKIVLLDNGMLHFGIQNKNSKFFKSNKLVNVESKIESMKLDLCERNIVVTENPANRLQYTKEVAKKINQYLSEFLQRHKISSSNQGCLGIISMDFPKIIFYVHFHYSDCTFRVLPTVTLKFQSHQQRSQQRLKKQNIVKSWTSKETPTIENWYTEVLKILPLEGLTHPS